MAGRDILKELRKKDGLERKDLYSRVKHLVNEKSFVNNIRSLIKSKDIYKIERTKYVDGVRHLIIRFFIM